MICEHCTWAADRPVAAREFPEQGHAARPGCDCQHGASKPHGYSGGIDGE
ncbi:hypothetical protein [Streptomyces sp. WAC 01529]|nr:hypothetical protein [Streptomyces sp. WAC 01529]